MTNVDWPVESEALPASLIRAALALIGAAALAAAALYVTHDRDPSTVEVFAVIMLIPLLALAAVGWGMGMWRRQTHIAAQAVLVAIGIWTMPFAAFVFEVAVECNFQNFCS